MKKEEYIKAIDKIRPKEELKKNTLDKIKNKKKSSYVLVKYVVSFALICICMMFGIKEANVKYIAEKTQEEIKIPTVTFEEIYEIAKNQSDTANRVYDLAKGEQEKQENISNDEVSQYSNTNVQVEGIDELDLVKQDGEYIYYVVNNIVKIIDIKDINNPKEVAEIELEANYYIRGIYIYKNKLVIIKDEYQTKTIEIFAEDKEIYNNDVKNYVQILIYDIQNRENPIKQRSVQIEGRYISSRLKEGELFIITNQTIYGANGEDENYYKPTYRDSVLKTDIEYINYDRIYKLQDSNIINYTLIGRLDLNEEKEVNITTFFGMSNELYMSNNNIYIASYNYISENTSIYRFEIDKEKIKLIGKCEIKGNILNQFSMDEYNDNLRVVTKKNTSSTIYVINKNMEIIGKLDNLANGEDLKSVRFDGKRAFVVTYKESDPLFVIELENPSEIKILGELKIPGYSQYLEVYDETHLLGIGEDTKQTKTGEQRDGMKVTMFDISDLENPKELSTVKIKDKYAFSEVLYNHKILLNMKEAGIIGFPISYNQYNKQGAIIINVDENKNLSEKGIITHQEQKRDYDSNIKRVIYNKYKIITLSDNYLKVNDAKTLEEINKIKIKKQ